MQTVPHAQKQARWRPQRQVIALATLGVFVAIIVGTLYLSQSSQMATLGRELEDLIQTRDRLEQTNEQLRAEIAGLQGMANLQTRAQEMGFRFADRSDIEYLVVQGYNPNREAEIAPREVIVEDIPVYDESLIGWLQQQIDSFQRDADS